MLKCLVVLALTLFGLHVSAESRTPVVLELFTSEGCSSCPPADALAAEVAAKQPVAGADVILLGEHVDYWNYIGWTDRFSSKQWTQRQEQYVRGMHLESAYTPQLVVDGKTQLVGGDRKSLLAAIDASARQPKPAAVTVQAMSGQLKVDVRSDRPVDADVLLAVTENDLSTQVRAGENGGRVLQHPAVLRVLHPLGHMNGTTFATSSSLAISKDWNRDKLRAIVLVQAPSQREILGAASVALK